MAAPPTAAPASGLSGLRPRITAQGKFLWAGRTKFWVRGVTYGTFRPDDAGSEYPERAVVERDLTRIASNGLNAVRTYTVPPRWFLDAAHHHGLRVMVGLPWEQHVAFLDDRTRARAIRERVRAGVRACAGHPALLCYAVGNEIPSPIVRWLGARRVERYLESLHAVAKTEDPHALVTYVNYPTTEYLELPFLDIVCFNVYLEAQDRLQAYLARLHNLAGERPLIMAEIGLDSRRNGENTQARVLDWQIRTAFASGCAGAFVFAWTDEWHRGGHDVDDWDFGLTTRGRRPKAALGAARRALMKAPLSQDHPWPSISVVVCSYNGSRTIRECLEGLKRVEYPNFEVIVVDDGSTDTTAAIARESGFRLISTPNRGLSNARNTGLAAATGEIVAYIDDDAWPDPDWLTYLAAAFVGSTHVGVGGPNIAPPGDGLLAECVANAPGGPVHVLLSDREAEHIPGCNMAFRKAALEAIGGFDPQFRTAGDDVDVCWRLQQRGGTLGFAPSAMVWHHRRGSLRAYWNQQRGYGRAEAMLERKWPEKYNAAGHVAWRGRIYGRGLAQALGLRRGRVYHGTWGAAPFQSLYQPATGLLRDLPLMPDWYLTILGLALLSTLGLSWPPLAFAVPLLVTAMGFTLVQAGRGAARAVFAGPRQRLLVRSKARVLTALLYLVQPGARTYGRVRHGLTPWRQWRRHGIALPHARRLTIWCERWGAVAERLTFIEATLAASGASVQRGSDYDRWDLEVRGGSLGSVRLLVGTEEHGHGRQLLRFRTWPRGSRLALWLIALLGGLAAGALLDDAWVAGAILGGSALFLLVRIVHDCAAATAGVRLALSVLADEEQAEPARRR